MDNAIKKWKQLSGEMEQAQALPEEPQVTT
jgi:hypothetical protein